MSKNCEKGFSLAEILITLAIIGVVAALTIPLLLTQINNMRYKTEFKKLYSSIEQATISIKNDNGGSLVGLFTGATQHLKALSMYNQYAAKMNFLVDWDDAAPNPKYVEPIVTDLNGLSEGVNLDSTPYSGYHAAILNNGALLSFDVVEPNCDDTLYIGQPICGYIAVATEGIKGPNVIGEDIFIIYITPDHNLPAGISGDNNFIDADISCVRTDMANGSGAGCAYYVLNNKNY